MSRQVRVTIRELHLEDRAALRAFFLALDEDDRYRRFGRAMSDEAVTAYADALDWTDVHVLGAYDRRADLVGVLELAGLHEGSCEIAVVVSRGHRAGGIGKALMERALLKAKVCGCARVVVLCQVDNQAMRRLARGAGMQASQADGDVEGRLELRPASLGDLTEDAARGAVANAAYAALLTTRTWADLFEATLRAGSRLLPQR